MQGARLIPFDWLIEITIDKQCGNFATMIINLCN